MRYDSASKGQGRLPGKTQIYITNLVGGFLNDETNFAMRYGDGGAAAALVTAVADAYAALERGEPVSRADTWEGQIEQNS